MSATATLKAEREARKAKRAADKAAKLQALADAEQAAKTAMTPPPSLANWGVVQTRCWVAIHTNLTRQTRLKRKSADKLCHLTQLMRELPNWGPERCNQVAVELMGGAA